MLLPTAYLREKYIITTLCERYLQFTPFNGHVRQLCAFDASKQSTTLSLEFVLRCEESEGAMRDVTVTGVIVVRYCE